jgi:hypothetical protein
VHPVIPPEMTHAAVQIVAYFVAVVTAWLSFSLVARA